MEYRIWASGEDTPRVENIPTFNEAWAQRETMLKEDPSKDYIISKMQ